MNFKGAFLLHTGNAYAPEIARTEKLDGYILKPIGIARFLATFSNVEVDPKVFSAYLWDL